MSKQVQVEAEKTGGILARKLKESLNMDPRKGRILVTEDGGLPVICSLKRTDPFRKPQCRFNDPKCLVEEGKDCAKTGILYEISCKACNQKVTEPVISRGPGSRKTPNYVGMTRTSTHCRMLDHLKGQRLKYTDNPLHRHDEEGHQGEVQEYTTRILATERNLLPLAIIEGLFIERQHPQTSINGRNEAGRGALVRLIASR